VGDTTPIRGYFISGFRFSFSAQAANFSKTFLLNIPFLFQSDGTKMQKLFQSDGTNSCFLFQSDGINSCFLFQSGGIVNNRGGNCLCPNRQFECGSQRCLLAVFALHVVPPKI
jgi:hypothetical protein